MAPADRQLITQLGSEATAPDADRLVRVVVDLAAGDSWRPLIEQAGQGANQPGLTLAALPEQDNVVPGDERPLQMRAYGVAEPEYPRKSVFARAQSDDQVRPYLVFDGHEPVTACA